MGYPLADHVVDLPAGVQFTFHLERIRDYCDPLKRLDGKFNTLSMDELWNRIQQSHKLPPTAFTLTNPRHLESLPALPEQPMSTEPPNTSTRLNHKGKAHSQVDRSQLLANGPHADFHLPGGILSPPVQSREPLLAIQLRELRCQLTAKANNRLHSWMSETLQFIHHRSLEALEAKEACESCADRKFRFRLKPGKKCESSTLSAWLGERKTMWRDLRRVRNSTSAEEDKCIAMIGAKSRLAPMIERPKVKRKKPKSSGVDPDSRKKRVKCNTNVRKKSAGNAGKMKTSGNRKGRPEINISAPPKAKKRKKLRGDDGDSREKKTKYAAPARKKSTSGTLTRRPKVNESAARRLEGSRYKGPRFGRRKRPTMSRKGSTGTTRASGAKRKRLLVDSEDRKPPRPQMRVTQASGRSTTGSLRTSSRRLGGDKFDVGDCVQAWDGGLYTAKIKGVESRGGRAKYLVRFVDKSRGELTRWMNADDLVPIERNYTQIARAKPSSILPEENAKWTIMPPSRRKKSVRAKRWYCKVLVDEAECGKLGLKDGMCKSHYKAFEAAGRSTKG